MNSPRDTGREYIFSGACHRVPSLSIRGKQTAPLFYLPSCQHCFLKAVVALVNPLKSVAVNRAPQKWALSPDLITKGPTEEATGSIWSPASWCLQTQTNLHNTEESLKGVFSRGSLNLGFCCSLAVESPQQPCSYHQASGTPAPRSWEDFSLWHDLQLTCIKGLEAARVGSEEQFQLLLQRAHCAFVTGNGDWGTCGRSTGCKGRLDTTSFLAALRSLWRWTLLCTLVPATDERLKGLCPQQTIKQSVWEVVPYLGTRKKFQVSFNY